MYLTPEYRSDSDMADRPFVDRVDLVLAAGFYFDISFNGSIEAACLMSVATRRFEGFPSQLR
jgi:hypothetical protein